MEGKKSKATRATVTKNAWKEGGSKPKSGCKRDEGGEAEKHTSSMSRKRVRPGERGVLLLNGQKRKAIRFFGEEKRADG